MKNEGIKAQMETPELFWNLLGGYEKTFTDYNNYKKTSSSSGISTM